jgi:hypothetical protein
MPWIPADACHLMAERECERLIIDFVRRLDERGTGVPIVGQDPVFRDVKPAGRGGRRAGSRTRSSRPGESSASSAAAPGAPDSSPRPSTPWRSTRPNEKGTLLYSVRTQTNSWRVTSPENQWIVTAPRSAYNDLT